MLSKSKKQLSKIKMPGESKPEFDMASEAADEEGSPDEESAPMEELDLTGEEPEMESPEASPLADIGDEELLAEIKKRGLMSELEQEPSEGPSAEELPEDL